MTQKKWIHEEISFEAHRVINKTKAEKDFKEKGEALDFILLKYGKEKGLIN